MYQFYYADQSKQWSRGVCKDDMREHLHVTAIRPAMWEEHCLECAAPLCYHNCLHYQARSDGRCKRFENSFFPFHDERACCGQGVHIQFRKWANMMTIVFPAMLSPEAYQKLYQKNEARGNRLKHVADSHLPVRLRWEMIRTVEFLRRRKLRALNTQNLIPDAFVFHGYSYMAEPFHLIIEIYDDHTPTFKLSLELQPGENLKILTRDMLSQECWTADRLVKIYPENDLEAELDILWCDFVQGTVIPSAHPAQKLKCMVWDLDNTLWDGTLIETEHPEQLALRPHVLETIQELDRRGIIQSIASKNELSAAWPVVERLGLAEYFLYPQIHWNAKSASLEQIAKSLNIGIDALGLIDDSAFEREQVRSAWPQVRVYDVTELPDFLHKPEVDVLVTEESRCRRAMYRAEEKRNQIMSSGNEDIVSFLKKCNLQIELFEPKTQEELLRCYELVVRTNQLNMSGVKYTQEEFQTVLKRSGHTSFAFSCKDDFGAYGIVGFGQYTVENNALVFREFAMSCRVAGKYVESALFAALLEKNACTEGRFQIRKTQKNKLLRKTLKEIGFHLVSDSEEQAEFCFNTQLKNSELVKCLMRNR